jgi:spermidine/putrescine transport system substrate-binding protein
VSTLDTVHDTVVVAAILAGVNPFEMSPADMEKVANKLREQRPLLRSYTTDMTSVEQSLASGELVAAMTWNASAHALRKQDVPVEFMKPKEGMLTWTCGFVLLKNSKNVDLAYDFINSRLEAESGKELINQYSYGSTSSAAFGSLSKEDLERTHLPADPEIMLKSTRFSQPMRQIDDVAKMFEKIKAGG